MIFRFKADCTFEAEGIDHAFAKLSQHFNGLACDDENELLEFLGEIEIKPDSDAGGPEVGDRKIMSEEEWNALLNLPSAEHPSLTYENYLRFMQFLANAGGPGVARGAGK